MAKAVIMPRQGQSVESCIITKWYKKPGDGLSQGDLLFSYETDKAAFDEEVKEEGILLAVFYAEGDEVPVLTNIAVIGKTGEEVGSFKPMGSSVTHEQKSAAPARVSEGISTGIQENPSNEIGKKRVSPRARKVARELGIDPYSLLGSGPMGRVVEKDVRNAPETLSNKVISVNAPLAPITNWTYTFDDKAEIKKISNVRKLIAANMQASLQNSAQLTHHMGADARKILALREKIKESIAKKDGANVTLNDMVCFAVIRALKKTSAVNCHFLTDQIKYFEKVHLGIAVDTERGLMVPVLRNADDYSIQGLSEKLRELAESCRKGSVPPEILASTSGTFTVSNLGSLGVEMFTPVINLPQVGILGVNTIIHRPADLGGGTIGFVPYIGLSLSYDHRAIDGAPASAFLREIKLQIENLDFVIE
jgi:pyruvate dehydrogenase E2 component (dihydrolipoamide acetyltransferase)